ncbi:MAG: ATP-binding protein [Alphaproteobacteria bacterium]|nr:ATP-binding protein [Alphaproteobacteria bacterium]
MPKIFSTSNWPFALKFAIPSLLALILVCVIEYAALNALNVIKNSLNDVVERKYNASLLLEQCVDRLRAVNGELYLLQTKKAAGMEQDVVQRTKELSDQLEQISVSLSRFKSYYARPEDLPQIDGALQNVRQYRKAVGFVGSMLDIDFKATVTFIVPLRGAYEEMIGNLSSVSNDFLVASRKASERADSLARARTQFILIFSSAVLILSLGVMIPLAYSTVRSIKTLAAATVHLADGDTRIDLNALARHDELGRLVSALTVFRDNIERVAMLKKVSLLYASMNAMLNSLKEGLFTFGPDGVCSENYSTACVKLLNQTPSGHPLADVLNMSASEREGLQELLNLIFIGSDTFAMSVQSLLDMLPRYYYDADDKVRKGETPISLAYRPILNASGNVQSVLVIATDHSEEIAAAQLNQERQNRVLRTLRLLSSRNMFVRFWNGIMDFFSQPQKLFADASLEQVKRDVHTFKGVAGIYYLDKVAKSLHHVETVFPDSIEPGFKGDTVLMAALVSVKTALSEAREEISEILGPSFDKQGMIRTISLDSLKDVLSCIPADEANAALRLKYTTLLIGEPIHSLLANTQAELRELADRYGKALEQPRIEGENFPILTESYGHVFASLTHISRNIIRHGVEEPDVRKQRGKPEKCTVIITTEKIKRNGADWFRIVFHDNGSGIDPNRLKQLPAIASNKALAKASREELLQHLFDGNMSTANEVTALGGRGVGMSAVKVAAEEVGGSARIESSFHNYTKIVIELPFIWKIAA